MAFLCYDHLFLEHDAGPGHPESEQRLIAILGHLEHTGLSSRLAPLDPRSATREEIEEVHARGLFDLVRAFSERTGHLDPDTHLGRRSFDAALLAAGATLVAADAVMAGRERTGLCLVRPPGHHSTPTRPMGFCLFNNIAICARYLRRVHGVARLAIVDFDVHHGNGTEDAFREDPGVFYLSTHRVPFFPGTGMERRPAGSVAVRNFPLRADTTPAEFHDALEAGLEEVERFEPEVLLVSAGFDAHELDPIAGLGLRESDFRRIGAAIADLARRTAEGRVISTLEGGYALRVLGPCVEEYLLGLDPELATGS